MMDFEAATRIQRLRSEVAAIRKEATERIRQLEQELQLARGEVLEARTAGAEARGLIDQARAEIAAARKEAAAARKEAAEAEKKYLSGMAEMENFKKRTERSSAEIAKTSRKTLFGKALGVLDNLGRAMEYEHTAVTDPAGLVAGLRLTYWQLQDLLVAEGIKPIDAVGVVFDPRIHEAVDIDTSGSAEAGVVTAELLKGYYYEDEVLRPAKVRVAGAVPRRTTPNEWVG